MDMIVSACKQQEECLEHRVAFYQVFVDFDSINMDTEAFKVI